MASRHTAFLSLHTKEVDLQNREREEQQYNEQYKERMQRLLDKLASSSVLAAKSAQELRRVRDITHFHGTLYVQIGVDDAAIGEFRAARPDVPLVVNVAFRR